MLKSYFSEGMTTYMPCKTSQYEGDIQAEDKNPRLLWQSWYSEKKFFLPPEAEKANSLHRRTDLFCQRGGCMYLFKLSLTAKFALYVCVATMFILFFILAFKLFLAILTFELISIL